MAHQEQIDFCSSIKKKFPEDFIDKHVLDVGSYDINGNNRYLFAGGSYTGVDLGPGPNVDITKPIHQVKGEDLYDVVISTEMLEHDEFWDQSLLAMYRLLKPGGLFILTAAGPTRPEHGTAKHYPKTSLFTNHYYGNISKEMVVSVFNGVEWTQLELVYGRGEEDIYIWGRK